MPWLLRQTMQTVSLPSQEQAGPHLSVIVPVHNGRLQLPRCLEALRESSYSNFEVIVVDDCSTDNTAQIIERFGARYLRTPRKLGPGGGRNLGVQHARGEIVVFVDADVVVRAQTLAQIAEDFQDDAQLAALFGSYDEEPAWPDFFSQYKNLMHHYVHQISSERAVTFWAGCGAVRKAVFEEFGGFNTEKYPNPSIEDIELGYRLSMAGRRIKLDKRIQVKHLKKWTVRGLWRADVHYRAIPWSRLILETRNLPKDLNLTRAAQISAGLVGLFVGGLLLLPFSLAGWLQKAVPALTPLNLSVVLGGLAAVLLLLNLRVYRWFAQRRGLCFAAGAVLAHWAYYFYSGVVFVACWIEFHLRGGARGAGQTQQARS
jgi:glycosyltransferase involved in cell wall biosynthesis